MSKGLHPRIAQALAAAQGVAPYHQRPIAEARAMARAPYLKPGAPIRVGAVHDLQVPAPHGAIPVRLYTPEPSPPRTRGPRTGEAWAPAGAGVTDGPAGAGMPAGPPLVVFFHGSGFVMLDLDTHDELCRRLCAGAACAVASVDYRLAPEHKFPAGPDDCLAATQWLLAHTREFGVDPDRFVLSGDSAGGCLAVVTALRLREQGGPVPRGQLLFYPVLDAPGGTASYEEFATGFGLSREGMEWFWGQYLQEPGQGTHPYAAPARMASVEGLPPAYIEVAEFDVLRDEGEAYARRLADSGIAVSAHRAPGMNHGFLKYAGELPEADASLARACEWLRARLQS